MSGDWGGNPVNHGLFLWITEPWWRSGKWNIRDSPRFYWSSVGFAYPTYISISSHDDSISIVFSWTSPNPHGLGGVGSLPPSLLWTHDPMRTSTPWSQWLCPSVGKPSVEDDASLMLLGFLVERSFLGEPSSQRKIQRNTFSEKNTTTTWENKQERKTDKTNRRWQIRHLQVDMGFQDWNLRTS